MTAPSRNPHPVVCGDVAPNEPPIKMRWMREEARANYQNIKNNLNIMHGQPPTPRYEP